MKFLHKYGTRSIEIERARKELYLWIFLAGAVLVFFALMILFARLGPTTEGHPEKVEDSVSRPAIDLTQAQLTEKRREVLDALGPLQVKAEANTFSPGDLETLEDLIALQESILGSDREDDEILAKLMALHDEGSAQMLATLSRQREVEAVRQNGLGNLGEALELLEEARDLQEKINGEFSRSPHRDPSRLHQLERKLILWQTEPVAQRADALKREALELHSLGRFPEALSKMEAAMEAQRHLEEEFRSSPFASLGRTREFERAWEQMQAAERAAQIQELISRAKNSLQLQQPGTALAAAEEAESLQRQIMAEFPALAESRQDVLDEILVLRDTAASRDDFDRLVELGELVSRKLQENDIENINNTLSAWLRACEAFAQAYPQSAFKEKIDFDRIDFLHRQRTEIPALLATVKANLIPVPGQPETLLYRTEVPQALFEKVTGKNPSSDRDPLKPVESVTWEEAMEFTRLMSWILARPAHLPSRETYLAALGPAEATGKIWSAESSGRETNRIGLSQPNAEGFVDLLGNVSEWLAGGSLLSSPSQVVAIGGSVRDSRERLLNIPEDHRQPGERNRFIGFRFSVQSP